MASSRRPHRHLVERVCEIIEAERELNAVLLEQVPYTRQLDVIPATYRIACSPSPSTAAGITLPQATPPLLLINNLVSTTVL